jgi:prophage DNA circulation protein
MTWKERLATAITFLSPSGQQFVAKWQRNNREAEKMIGEHSFPGRTGTVFQDLATKAGRYPLGFYFDGPDNDLWAAAFFEAFNEIGPWMVEHPVYGLIKLQPLRITEVTDPTDSGNITEFQSEWAEPLDEATLQTARQEWGLIEELQKDLGLVAATDFMGGEVE